MSKRKPIILLLKTHVEGYAKKDGTFVAPHEDNRAAKQKNGKAKGKDRSKNASHEDREHEPYIDGDKDEDNEPEPYIDGDDDEDNEPEPYIDDDD